MKKMSLNLKIILLVSCLLLVIIISGALTLYYLHLSANKLEKTVNDASISVENNQWESANKYLDDFENSWDKTKFSWSILLDHYEIDNIDNSFAKAKKYVGSKDFPSSQAELQALRQYILHIPKKESFSIENIL